jgi:hypothetical protein
VNLAVKSRGKQEVFTEGHLVIRLIYTAFLINYNFYEHHSRWWAQRKGCGTILGSSSGRRCGTSLSRSAKRPGKYLRFIKVLSCENVQGSKLFSDDRYCFCIVVLGSIFHFEKDTILDSFKNILPPLQQKKLKI